MNLFKKFFGVSSFVPKDGLRGELPTNREAYKNLMRIALPSVCEMVLISLIGSIDTMMVGGIGTEAIAAVGLVGQPRMLMLCIFFALNTGVTAVIARRKGEGKRDVANQTMRTSILLIMALSIVMMIIGLTFSRGLMRLAGAKADTIDDAETYFRITTMVIPFNALSMAICAAQRGTGNTKITMYVNIVSNLVNVLLNWLLINGVWIFPRLEVTGAAIATAIGIVVGCILALVSIFMSDREHSFLHLSMRDDWRWNQPAAKAVIKVGGNSMLEQIALRIGFFLYARLVAQLGTQAYASHVVCMQFLNLSFTFADGIGVASTSLVGQMLGKERPDLSHIYGKIAQRIAMVGSVMIASTIVILRYPLVSLFTDDPTVMRLSANVMLIVALFQPPQMLSVITSGALRGAGDTKYVARVMLVCVAIMRPVAAFLAIEIIQNFFTPVYEVTTALASVDVMKYWLSYEAPQWALMGAWGASFLDMTIRMALMMRRFNEGKWHSIKV